MSRIFHFILGCSSILIICVLTSNNQKNIRIRFILQTLIVEILLGYFILNSQIGIQSVKGLSYLFNILINFSLEGINFVFGNMNKQNLAFFFLNILCPITFISALIGILQYTKILSFSIQIIGTILSKINGMGKIESFNAISSLFLGQSENFIIYKNIMPHITEKCMYTMAATAMSTVSLSIVGAYMTLLPPKYVVVALILNMFSTFIVLSILNPHSVNEEKNYNLPILNIKNKKFFEVLNEYILIGFKIALTITAMLIGFIALISTFNFLFKILLGISFQEILGFLFLPFAWIIGIPTNEIFQISSIMATKLISNEFVAMINLQKISNNLSPQSIGILSVFLVSFANFSSIGIITGCIKELNKKQGNVISKYGLKLIYSSTLINLLSSTIAGLII